MQKIVLGDGKHMLNGYSDHVWIKLWGIRKNLWDKYTDSAFVESKQRAGGRKNSDCKRQINADVITERNIENQGGKTPVLTAEAQQEKITEKKLDMEFLIERYGNEILRMCYLYLHDLQLAEDAVQETYLKVFRSWDGYRGEAAEKTWIIRIAINTCITMRRKRWFRETSSAADLEQEIAVSDKYEDDTVVKSIYKLKPGLREVIIMFYYQQMKTKEISECLSISESAVCVRLNRARKRLGELLEGWYFDE